MCANCGPAGYNYDETLSTLRYANRAKNIRNKPKINEDPKDAMLREFQEEIQRLKAQIASGGGDGGGGGGYGGGGGGGGEIVETEYKEVERIVEVEKIVEIKGASEEELEEIRAKAAAEKARVKSAADAEMNRIVEEQAKTEKEKLELRAKLELENAKKQKAADAQVAMAAKLKSMEQKLLQGGEILSKAAKQEAMLRRKQVELEDQHEQERILARELQEKEEANLEMEEKFSGMQEECEVKTSRLKKMWAKLQQTQAEIGDLQAEQDREREELLDTIRALSRQLKLRDIVLQNFVPTEEERRIEAMARWSDGDDAWSMPHLELAGNRKRPNGGGAGSRGKAGKSRPGTASAKNRGNADEGAEPAAEAIHDPDGYYESEAGRIVDSAPPMPYQQYAGDDGAEAKDAGADRAAGKERGSKSSRPKTASRRRNEDK